MPTPEQVKVAMGSPSHLKQWLQASGRRWLVMDALDLVDALPWPAGVEALMQLIACYRDHRATISTGETELVADMKTGTKVSVPKMKGETLELTEMKSAVLYLINQIAEREPAWKPDVYR